MSGVRGIGDAFAFQRLLWLLVGTVIVPTVLLSLYGVMAIRNQQAALLEQVRRQREAVLAQIARDLFREIVSADAAVRQATASCVPERPCPVVVPNVEQLLIWERGTVPPASVLPFALPDTLGPETRWFTLGDSSDPLAVFAQGDSAVAWRLDVAGLGARTVNIGQSYLPAGVTAQLEAVSSDPATPMDEILQRWQQNERIDAFQLDRPLSQWRLALHYPHGQDPEADLLGANAWLYPLGLIALVTTVIVGTIITLSSAAREIRLSRLQTDFVSSVSHELRTPLTSIRLFVETLQSGRLQDPARVQECLDLLAQETDRLSRMIERVLDWARMEAGRRAYEFEAVSARNIVTDALAALRSQHLALDPASLVVDLPEDLPMIRADSDAIVEAVLNLLQNALRHTPEPRRIVISAVSRGRKVGITVSDNGPGISKADRKRVFEKFYQVDTRLSAPVQGGATRGSGLGLAIVRAMVRAHGGSVTLDTELGRGCAFTLWLPVA